jgi:hypothetical protein
VAAATLAASIIFSPASDASAKLDGVHADLARAVQLSQKPYEPEAAQASEHIREQVQARHGIEVNNLGADERSVSEALTRAQQARSQAETESTKTSAARTDEAVAGAAVAGANRQDRAAQTARAGPHGTPLNDAAAGRKPRRQRRSRSGQFPPPGRQTPWSVTDGRNRAEAPGSEDLKERP